MEQISEYLFTTEEQAVIARSKAEGSYMNAPSGQAPVAAGQEEQCSPGTHIVFAFP